MPDHHLIDAKWFDPTGACRCGKAATGVLRGGRNEVIGSFCEPCAKATITGAGKRRLKAFMAPR